MSKKNLLWVIPLAISGILSLYFIKNFTYRHPDIQVVTELNAAPTVNIQPKIVIKKEKRLYIDTLVKYQYTGIPNLDTAIYYLNKGTKEKTGNNDGVDVERFLRLVHANKGDAWCAAFYSYCLDVSDGVLLTRRSAAAQGFIMKNSISAKDVLYSRYKIPPGSAVIFKHGDTYKGHIGNVYVWDTYKGQAVEGNAGDKVSFLERHIEPRNSFRIVSFTLVPYRNDIQQRVNKYVPKWYNKNDNSTTNVNSTR